MQNDTFFADNLDNEINFFCNEEQKVVVFVSQIKKFVDMQMVNLCHYSIKYNNIISKKSYCCRTITENYVNKKDFLTLKLFEIL